ncbi:hypothetical protein BBJ28_00004706 [Nothophytophthora sp. Chile5]|nr:hypothetical protein BBJ28_00004706 [Nothophytophthora sp. Chile5]
MSEEDGASDGQEPAAQQAASVMQWLALYADHQQERRSATLRRLLQQAFPVAEANYASMGDWEAVLRTLEGFYETALSVDAARMALVADDAVAEKDKALRGVLELSLAAVVQSEEKATFVRDILAMADSAQADLMASIEKVMTQGVAVLAGCGYSGHDADASLEASEAESEVLEYQESQQQDPKSPSTNQVANAHSPLYLSRNAELERVKRENGVLKDEAVSARWIHMALELEDARAKLRRRESESGSLVETIQQLKVQLDTDVQRKERSLRALYDDRIRALQREFDVAKTELHDKTEVASKVPALRDEVDLLRPLADKMAKMETTLAKYKAKIDDLLGAKGSLREFRVCELETQLARQENDVTVVGHDLEASQNALQEAKALNVQLQATIDHQLSAAATTGGDNSSFVPAMTGGISEFNPELMQKVVRLEYENSELRKQVKGETSERIEGLLDEIEDLARLKKSFERKYFDTEQLLQATREELKQSRQQVEDGGVAFASVKGDLRRMTERRDELRTALDDANVHLKNTIGEFEASMRDLTLTLRNREGELTDLRSGFESLTREKERLMEQCEGLSMMREDLEAELSALCNAETRAKLDLGARLSRQMELTMMQSEDANAEWLRLENRRERELQEACQQHEDKLAAVISRMTEVVGTKSAEIEQLKVALQEERQQHVDAIEELKTQRDAERSELEAATVEATKELERYRELHTVPNADWSSKEKDFIQQLDESARLMSEKEAKSARESEALNTQIKELEESSVVMRELYEQQEDALKATVRSQLESNQRLVETNQALKVDVARKRSALAELENTTTQLESKVMSLEKVRAHFSTQEERKRDFKDETSSFSSQVHTQLGLVVAELEKVLEENKKLQQNLAGCSCDCRNGPSDQPPMAKDGHLSGIRQLEQDKIGEEQKRRELLLVNAKFIQEQKQLQVKNASLATEMQQLNDSIYGWLLRDERRKKDDPKLQLRPRRVEKDQGAVTQAKEARRSLERPVKGLEARLKPLEATQGGHELQTVADQENIAPANDTSRSRATTSLVATRKRKLDACVTRESSKPTAIVESEFMDAKEFFAAKSPVPRGPSSGGPASSKRRLSLFISSGRTSERQQRSEQTEKPAEGQEQ